MFDTLLGRARRRPPLVTALCLGLVLALSPSASQAQAPTAAKPTIVLVHGAFADASGWQGVAARLQKQGYTVLAPANPLRGVASDADYLRSILVTIEGPIVIVGHSYGGQVLTNAATGNPHVAALVYVAAFAPDEGETSGGLTAMFPGSQLTQDNLVARPYPISETEVGYDAYIAPSRFREIFCADLDAKTAAFMAAAQRPGAVSTLMEHSGVPAWRTIPSWYLVATQDRAIPPAAQRFMAERMGAHTRSVRSSHVAMISHPTFVATMITDAAEATD